MPVSPPLLPADDVVEFEDSLDAALSFVARQDTELDVIEVVEGFVVPRGWLVKAKSVDRLDGKVTEEHLSWNLVSGISLR